MDLNQIKTFVVVAKTNGFSAASRELNMPRSTVSAHIQALEAELKTRLFKRSTRSVTLTESGALLFQQSELAIETLQSAVHIVQETDEELSGLIRMSAPAEFPNEALVDAIVGFTNIHPKVTIDAVMTNRKVDLVRENIDLSLRVGMPDKTSTIIRKYAQLSFVFVASPECFAGKPKPESLEDLKDFQLCTYSAEYDSAKHSPISLFDEERLHCCVKSNSLQFLKRFALSGHGIAYLPEQICIKDIAENRLISLDLTDRVVVSTAVYLSFPSKKDISKKVRLFSQYLLEHLKNVEAQ